MLRREIAMIQQAELNYHSHRNHSLEDKAEHDKREFRIQAIREELRKFRDQGAIHDRILVRRVEEVGTTRGGIVIRILPKINHRRAKSSRLGEGKTNDEGKLFPLAVREGDRILFGKYSGTEIKIDGEDFLIMKEEEVLGVISGAAKKETVGAKR